MLFPSQIHLSRRILLCLRNSCFYFDANSHVSTILCHTGIFSRLTLQIGSTTASKTSNRLVTFTMTRGCVLPVVPLVLPDKEKNQIRTSYKQKVRKILIFVVSNVDLDWRLSGLGLNNETDPFCAFEHHKEKSRVAFKGVRVESRGSASQY